MYSVVVKAGERRERERERDREKILLCNYVIYVSVQGEGTDFLFKMTTWK